MSKPKTLYEVITEAVADITAHGFDSQRRVDEWMERIEAAAKRTMTSPDRLDQLLRETMKGLYSRLVEGGRVARMHPGVSAFTLREVKPKLRAELERRIMTSADLIKLNREQSIAKTLQRFQGWASSVPAGGSRVTDRRETKYDVGKALKQLPFEERRVIIDQGHKLTASINDVIAKDGGAIAAEWSSLWRETNYNYRKDHKERDGKVYLIRDSWAHKKGFVKPGPAGYADEITQPAEEPFCLPGDSPVELFHEVEKAYRRRYVGEMVTVDLADGSTIRATPNHPVMSKDGWVAIGDLQKGDQLLKVGSEGVVATKLQNHQRFARISDLFDAVVEAGATKEVRRGMAPNFHGDGTDEDIDVVTLARPLGVGRGAGSGEGRDEFDLPHPDLLRAAVGTANEHVDGLGGATHGSMSLGQRLVAHPVSVDLNTCGAQDAEDGGGGNTQVARNATDACPASVAIENIGGVDRHAARPLAEIDPALAMPIGDGGHADPERAGDIGDPFAFGTQPVEVVNVDRRAWAGHVFNLQVASGWYSVNGIITSNCRCHYRYIYSVRKLPEDMVTAKGREAMEAARAKVQGR